MSKCSVTVEESTRDEVTQWMTGGIRTYPSPEAAADWLAAVKPDSGSSGGSEPIPIPTSVPGFDKVIPYTWDWNGSGRGHDHVTIDTHAMGGIGTNGILIVSFVTNAPTDHDNLAMISAIGYPSPNMTNLLTVCVSETPGTLYAPEPGTATDSAPTVQYGVGTVKTYWTSGKPNAVALVPGKQYFINVAGRKDISSENPIGVNTVVPGLMYYPACDFRLEARKPAGH